jgi:signal transduction histidine kinase
VRDHVEREDDKRRLTIVICASVLIAGVAMSVWAYHLVRNNAMAAAQAQFERHASDAHHSIDARIMSYIDIVYGLRALMYSTGEASRLQFHKYVVGLDVQRRFPGFLNLNYAVQVPRVRKEQFEARVRTDNSVAPGGYPSFRIRPPGERPYYHVVTYLEPMKGNEFSLGRDITAAQPIREIFERVIFASDDLASSGRPPRIEGPPPFWGVAMRLPVYKQDVPLRTLEQKKAALLGTIGAGFRVDELLRNVLSREIVENLRFRVYEAGPVDNSLPQEEPVLLYDSKAPDAAPGTDPMPPGNDYFYRTTSRLNLAGRTWQIEYGARADSSLVGTNAHPEIVLFGGLLMTLLVCGIAYALASSRSRALILATEITADLRQSEEQARNYAERLKAVSRRLFEIQESERTLLATELHDRVGQNLSAIGMNISIIAAAAERSGNDDLVRRAEDSTLLIEETADSMRNVMGELRPQAIDEYGLLPPLRAFAARFASRTGVKVTLEGTDPDRRLPHAVEVAMFRIVQEALSNILKHAKATQVTISFEYGDASAAMNIVDDGVGFDARRLEAQRPEGHWGLLIMRERAEACGATLSIESKPGHTELRVVYHYGAT